MKCSRKAVQQGFTLLELLLALAIFMIVAGAAFSLFASHATLYSQQQNLAGLNVTLRNAVTMMELDVVNAGNGYYPGPNVPAWPVGLTVNNNQASSTCFNAAAKTYSAGCFDTLNIISVDPSTPPAHPDTNGGGTVRTDGTNSILFIDVPSPPVWTGSAAAFAGQFHAGDTIMVLNSDGSQMAVATLTQDGQLSGPKVQLNHNPTGASSGDPLCITNYAANHTGDAFNKLGSQFDQNAWVLRLATIQYSVDATDPTDPKLVRSINNAPPEILAEQVIGFKIGAGLWNGTATGDLDYYKFNNYSCDAYDPSQIRALRLSLIARTSPTFASEFNFHNSFDNGNYQIQALSVGINPRNLSMNDQ